MYRSIISYQNWLLYWLNTFIQLFELFDLDIPFERYHKFKNINKSRGWRLLRSASLQHNMWFRRPCATGGESMLWNKVQRASLAHLTPSKRSSAEVNNNNIKSSVFIIYMRSSSPKWDGKWSGLLVLYISVNMYDISAKLSSLV